MVDLVLDTDALADFLAQYFGAANRARQEFTKSEWLSQRAAMEINRIVQRFRSHENVESLVIASAFAFVELARKWDQLIQSRVTPDQLRAFLEQPPPWFDIAPVDEDLVEDFFDVPAHVGMPNGETKPIEWTDAIHVATTFSREANCLLVTQDHRIQRVERLHNRIV